MPRTPFEVRESATLKAVLVGIYDNRARTSAVGQAFSWEESMRELSRLAETLDYEVAAQVTQEREAPDPATYVGKGKARELLVAVDREDAACVIVDGRLTPTQLRNLEDLTGVTVMDRTDLILRIFAARANTAEGKLQVQMASDRHALARLSGVGTEMSNWAESAPGVPRSQDRDGPQGTRSRIAGLNRAKRVARQSRTDQETTGVRNPSHFACGLHQCRNPPLTP